MWSQSVQAFDRPLKMQLKKNNDRFLNTLEPRQNGRHVADDIFNTCPWTKMVYWFKTYWNLSAMVQLIMCQYWLRYNVNGRLKPSIILWGYLQYRVWVCLVILSDRNTNRIRYIKLLSNFSWLKHATVIGTHHIENNCVWIIYQKP